MKRFLSIILIVSLISVLFSACDTRPTVKVNGTKIDKEVYAYFQNTSGDKLNEAVVKYVTINSEAAKRNIQIPKAQRLKLSETVNNIWHFFGDYYEKLDISKETIYKIETSKQLETALLINYYSSDGVSPVSEDEIKAYFDKNYASVRFVTGYLFSVDDKGATVPMNQSQKESTVNKFVSTATLINEGTSVEEAVGALGSDAEIHSALINSFSNENLPEGFFPACQKIEKGKAAAVALGDYVFLVQRLDAFDEEYGYYETYRNDCLSQMKKAEFDSVVAQWSKGYSIN